MVNVFIKGKISNRDFLVDLLFRHLVAKVKSIPFNTSIVKYKTSIFHRKDLRVLVQFPTSPRQGSNSPPPGMKDSQMPVGYLGGNVEALNWSANYFHFFISIRLHCERASRALRAPLFELNMFLHPVGKRLSSYWYFNTMCSFLNVLNFLEVKIGLKWGIIVSRFIIERDTP